MKMEPVESSAIKAVGYDPKSKLLAVQFTSGDTYHYENVPEHVHEGLMSARSVGGHFHQHIRRGPYPFHKAR